MEDISRTIVALTSMIAVNGKRSKTYQSLAEKTDNNELKALFSHYADQSKRYTTILSNWRSAYGWFGGADQQNVSRPWAQVWSLLDMGRSKNMTDQCSDLEDEVLKVYRWAISSSFMPPATAQDVEQQVKEFEKALTKLKSFLEHREHTQPVLARK